MRQTSSWPAGLKAKFKDESFLWNYHCLLLQPCHITTFCSEELQQADAPAQQLTCARLQRFVTALSRITMQQRLQLVFQGYKARFAEIGVLCQGLLHLP